MKVLIVNQQEVRELMPMADCIGLMESALKELANGNVVNPLRSLVWTPNKKGILGMMPSAMQKDMGIKMVSVFPGNHGTEFDSHQGAVLLFETENGQLLSIQDASEITAIRTAAVSGLATKLLARENSSTVAILGSGIQAKTHVQAMLAARSINKFSIWSRNFEHAKSFADKVKEKHGVEAEAFEAGEDAVRGSDIICTTTASPDPILFGEWLEPGQHINAAGSSVKTSRELDTSAVVKSRLFIDRLESTVNEAGDFLIPQAEGALDESHIQGEIGDILIGKLEARKSANEITLFKSLGLGVEDVASARHIYDKAVEQDKGTWIELGGERD